MASPKAGRIFSPQTEATKRHKMEPIVNSSFQAYQWYCVRCGKKYVNKSIGEGEKCYGR